MLCRNSDFFLYIFSPLTVLILYGYMYQMEDVMIGRSVMYGIFMGGLIRAAFGLCTGSVSYLLYAKIKDRFHEKKSVFLTVCEIILYGMFFCVLFSEQITKRYTFVALILLPFAIAISFSENSYVSFLFKTEKLKTLNYITLALYLNHWSARLIVQNILPNASYKLSVCVMMIFTALIIIPYCLLLKLGRLIIKKRESIVKGQT